MIESLTRGHHFIWFSVTHLAWLSQMTYFLFSLLLFKICLLLVLGSGVSWFLNGIAGFTSYKRDLQSVLTLFVLSPLCLPHPLNFKMNVFQLCFLLFRLLPESYIELEAITWEWETKPKSAHGAAGGAKMEKGWENEPKGRIRSIQRIFSICSMPAPLPLLPLLYPVFLLPPPLILSPCYFVLSTVGSDQQERQFLSGWSDLRGEDKQIVYSMC